MSSNDDDDYDDDDDDDDYGDDDDGDDDDGDDDDGDDEPCHVPDPSPKSLVWCPRVIGNLV